MTDKHIEPSEEVSISRSQEGTVRLVILVLFFLSGACGLTYEVVWMRMLTLVFGATAFATSTILASFFGGLALGGVYFGRVVDKGRNPLLVYALLEAGIGIFAFLMPLLFSGLTEIYVSISRHLAVGFYGISLIRLALSFLVLLIPATLMGGTLPVIIKFFVTRQERLGWHVGQLYAVNTFGAVVGTLTAGFFFILMLGVKETAYVAGFVNLLIAGVVLALGRRPAVRRVVDTRPREREKDRKEIREEAFSSKAAHLALWAIGLSGFCALALEVFWTRALVFFLDNSTHAFTTILTAFLVGIAVGSLLIARFVDTNRKLLAWLGSTEILIGVSAILAIPILSNSPPVFQSMADVSVDSMLPWKWMGMRFVNSLAVMLVPTVLMGMAFPLASKIYVRNVNRVGTALGNVYAVNTIGGVFGSVVAGFALIPLIGVQNGIILIAAINVIIGCVLVLSEPGMQYRMRLVTVVGLGLLSGSVGTFYLTSGAIILTSYYEEIESPEVLSYEEGIGATVKVYDDRVGDRTLSVNGFPVAGTALTMQDIQRALAHLPLLLSNVPSPRVNIVGFGSGGTSWGVMQYDVAAVDCVELVPAVVAAAGWFPETNHGVLSDPRFNLIRGDGRNYALVTDEEYDVISVDATSPKMAGNGSLYALEFYELLKERLSNDGLLVQWLPFHLLSDREVRMIAKTFLTAFPHSTLWFTPLRQYVILVGTQESLEVDFQSLSGKLAMSNVQRELEPLNVTDPIDFLGSFVMGEEALARYAGDADINTDNRPYLEFVPAMAYFVSDMYLLRNLRNLMDSRESVFPSLINIGETNEKIAAVVERVQKRFEATQHSISGDILLRLGMQEQAEAEYNTALQIDPQEKNWLNTIWLYPRR
jgi:spermidine synthase